MPVDLNILAGMAGPRVQINDPLETAMRGRQYEAAGQENALAGMKMQQMQEDRGVQQELDNFDGKDPSQLSRRAQKMFASNQAAQQKAQIEDHMAKVDAGSQLAGGAYDQTSWDAFRGQMQNIAPDMVERIPAKYSKEARDGLVNAGIKAKDSMNQSLREIDQQMRMMQIQQTGNNQREMMDFRRDQQDDRNSKAGRPIAGGDGNFYTDNGDGTVSPMTIRGGNPNTNALAPQNGQPATDGSQQPVSAGQPFTAPKKGAASGGDKPMSSGNVDNQTELTNSIGRFTENKANADALIGAILAKKIDIGRGANIVDTVANNTVSTDNSRNKAQLETFIKSLQMALQSEQKGTQTAQDSLNILAGIQNNPYDEENVIQQLKKISANQDFEAKKVESQLGAFRESQMLEPMDVVPYRRTATTQLSGMQQAPRFVVSQANLQKAANERHGGDINAAIAAIQSQGGAVSGQ